MDRTKLAMRHSLGGTEANCENVRRVSVVVRTLRMRARAWSARIRPGRDPEPLGVVRRVGEECTAAGMLLALPSCERVLFNAPLEHNAHGRLEVSFDASPRCFGSRR